MLIGIALLTAGGAHPAQRRRRSGKLVEEGEGAGDRLDRLVEQYRAKLSGQPPNRLLKSNSNSRANGKRGAKGDVGMQAKAPGPQIKMQAKGKEKHGVMGGADLAAMVAGAAKGGLRRWFDG